MAGESTQDHRTNDEREPRSDLHPTTKPSQKSGPPLFNDGPELIRDNHC
ncbi:hypothetical protein [Bradyrhizobium canariense]|uniref:Uncharacterized protein n=1 Tax=Bradyrhizobium canariense TaxID=255045 RepID=A0A1H1N099_9BRAD|nr:hypothetical protein [Bradyrhizobium canariense]SDR92340.1 hypothetical protein SAMN05444158_0430 [Bradyrhizobium canariense]